MSLLCLFKHNQDPAKSGVYYFALFPAAGDKTRKNYEEYPDQYQL